jgi:hypothetical protein
MSKNIHQIFLANPITTNASTDLMYFGQSPYTSGADDAAMTFSNFSAQFITKNILTTKGDLLTFSTVPIRLPVGTVNNQMLQVNSSAATGIAWGDILLTTIVYVSSSAGSDATGNGSINRPYKTIAFAMSSITTNTSANVFTIYLLDYLYTETVQIKLKAFVNIVSSAIGAQITSSLTIILDPTSWTGINYGYAYYSNLQFNCNLDLDVTTTSATTAPFIELDSVTVYGTFTFNGGDVGAPNGFGLIYIFNSEFAGNVYLNNVNGGSSGSNAYLATLYFATLDFSNFTNFFNHADSIANLVLGGGTPGGYQFYDLTACEVGTITINAGNVRLTSDVSSYVNPTILSGSPNIIIRNISDSLTANFTPSNYTPTATAPTLTTSVRAHLQGIDADLANFNVGNKSIGTTTNDNAVAGHVGEFVSNSASGVSVTSGTSFNAITISLTEGDWDVSGVIGFIAASTTVPTNLEVGINTTSATLPTLPPTGDNYQGINTTFATSSTNYIHVGPTRISIASTTTVYLVGNAVFTTSTMTAAGFMRARRIR